MPIKNTQLQLPPVTHPYGEKTRRYTTAALLTAFLGLAAARLVVILKRQA